jgi:putative peptide maturation dehydrogenase
LSTTRVRRTRFVAFECPQNDAVDLEALLAGDVRLVPDTQLVATSALTGESHPVSLDDLALLLSVPVRWTPLDAFQDRERVLRLADRGLLVADGDGALAELRRRDDALTRSRWHALAAVTHAGGRWRGVDILGEVEPPELASEDSAADFLARAGKPPPHFHVREDARAARRLPLERPTSGLFGTLARRRTSRGFDTSRALRERDVALVLDQVFGVHGSMRVVDELVLLKKTSPSGGALHPIEAYPLVVAAAGVPTGLYHYAAGSHSLELLERLDAADARRLAERFAAGQSYFAAAHVLVVLAARFERRFWKYRKNAKAYASLLLETGHLSQTLYLVATELGLGAFVTAAINSAEIDERLGLDGFSEGALALCGFGYAAESPLDPPFEPYRPAQTAEP